MTITYTIFMFNMTSRQPCNGGKTTAAVRKTKKAQFTFTSVTGIELKVTTPFRCKYCRDFILENLFSLSHLQTMLITSACQIRCLERMALTEVSHLHF